MSGNVWGARIHTKPTMKINNVTSQAHPAKVRRSEEVEESSFEVKTSVGCIRGWTHSRKVKFILLSAREAVGWSGSGERD